MLSYQSKDTDEFELDEKFIFYICLFFTTLIFLVLFYILTYYLCWKKDITEENDDDSTNEEEIKNHKLLEFRRNSRRKWIKKTKSKTLEIKKFKRKENQIRNILIT